MRRSYAEVGAAAEIDLRLGFELTPTRELLDDDPHRYELGDTGAVLMEVPFSGPIDPLLALAEHVERAGLQPVIAHPERTEAVLADPRRALELADRGWSLQVNATSLLGRHGRHAEEIAWRLLEHGAVALVGSDGHRVDRPAHLDDAYDAVRRRLGERAAVPLFDGSALGLAPAQLGAIVSA